MEEDVEKQFKKYLSDNNAKEELAKLISNGIDKFKSKNAYKWYDDGNPYDSSGSVIKLDKTIGEICKTDIEVLQALSGNSTATYISHYGLSWDTVADELCYEINDFFHNHTKRFVFENKEKVCEKVGFEEELEEDNFCDFYDYFLPDYHSIFEEWFPEYIVYNEITETFENVFNGIF